MDYARNVLLSPVDGGGASVYHHQYHRSACCVDRFQKFLLSSAEVERSSGIFFTYGLFIATKHEDCHIAAAGQFHGFLNRFAFLCIERHVVELAFREIAVDDVASLSIFHFGIGQIFLQSLIYAFYGSVGGAVAADEVFGLVGVWADHGHALQIFAQRERIPFVLEEHYRLECRSQRHLLMVFAVYIIIHFPYIPLIRVVEKAELEFHPQHVADARVDGRFRYKAPIDGFPQGKDELLWECEVGPYVKAGVDHLRGTLHSVGSHTVFAVEKLDRLAV